MLKDIVLYLVNNPDEALAVVEGRVSLLDVDAEQLLDIIRYFSSDNIVTTVGFWA